MTPNASPDPQRQAHQNDEIDLLALFVTLWDRKVFIAAVTLIFFISGIFYALLATPVYRADAVIQVEEKSPGLPGLSEMSEMLGSESGSTTEIELIKSRRVLGTAVDKLNLDIDVKPNYFPVFGKVLARHFPQSIAGGAGGRLGLNGYAWGGESLQVVEFTVPEEMYGARHTIVAQQRNSYALQSPAGVTVLEGTVGSIEEKDGYSLFVRKLTANSGTKFSIVKKRRLSAILGLQATLEATQKGKDSGIIALTLEGTNPSHIENVLNVIAQGYLRQNVERQSAEASKSLEFLRAQLPIIKKDLEEAERRFNDYQVKVGSVNISAEASALLKQVVDVEAAIAELQLQQAELDRKYTRDHPAYQAWREQMAEQRTRKAEMNEKIKNLPETQQELLGLKRDLEVGTEIYTQMLNNIQELDIVRAGTVGNVRIVDDAAVNVEEPVKPKKALIVVIATLLGGFLAVAAVLVRAALNRGVENPDDIEAIGMPVYASIPLSDEQRKLDGVKSRNSSLLRKRKSQHPQALLAQRNPTDIAVESLRSLRTSLHFAMLESSNNIMMISGPSPNVGKSFVSGNLAAVVAQAGQKVLLIDMDLRKGYMHKMFDLGPENGVSDVLAKRLPVQEAIKQTRVGELFFMPRGVVPPNPSELLMSKGLTELLDEVKDQFDLIIVDTPPIMAVTDAAIVGRQCGVTMIVARFGLNPVKELEATKHRFEQNGIQVKGVVLNAVTRSASGYGYGYGYGYYNYHYEYKSDKA
ncbi:polysaccharide biosynthesis tyrosine autokinase [Spongiibacter sp. KMU-166]|uniref:Polysaccharide biosynthesis tyrosine autokinase n=1 Tax=Spongiibacter thalassae TaxID=2721624 RepID=A0ABX1GK05_9GAMM|nr:polysaccharide biosynthesis tyrosine autokinase [Spongiibacter thalassae]NKI19564.1 polysaccharide biosynthesis tyrosine autokinase [Spongiibacter thalassae]